MSFSAPTSRAQRSRRILPWLLYLYALVLFAMHFVRIFDNSFWGDEGFTIRLVKASFYRMCRLTAGDVHPPLYYFFTQILYHIFGNHGYTYHLSALIPYGIILVFGLYSGTQMVRHDSRCRACHTLFLYLQCHSL